MESVSHRLESQGNLVVFRAKGTLWRASSFLLMNVFFHQLSEWDPLPSSFDGTFLWQRESKANPTRGKRRVTKTTDKNITSKIEVVSWNRWAISEPRKSSKKESGKPSRRFRIQFRGRMITYYRGDLVAHSLLRTCARPPLSYFSFLSLFFFSTL